MESADNQLLERLFGSGSKDSPQYDPEFSSYLTELGLLGSDQLVHEPDRLSSEKAQLQLEAENLAFSHYKTFIQAANCSKDVYEDFTLIEQRLSTVLENLPGLTTECNSFLNEARQISRRRNANLLTLNKHSQLLEILEIPQVMDTCVKGGYYEQALELSQYVSKLHRRLSHLPIIHKIAEEVNQYRSILIEQLLEQLRGNLTLPNCLKIISYLRRIGVFTEAELRIKFLLSRGSWLQNLLNSVPKDDAYQHLNKVMELYREHLFDIVTQYRAVFSDDDPLLVSVREQNINYPAIFHSWLLNRINQFLDVLEDDLRRGVSGRMDSVLTQAMYFGVSFARIGADFRSLVKPVFERVIIDQFEQSVFLAGQKIVESVKKPDLLWKPYDFGEGLSSVGPTTSDPYVPPKKIMQSPALAVYCNSVMTAFNDLRLCLPLNLAKVVKVTVEKSCDQISNALLELRAGSAENSEPLRQFSTLFLEVFLPFLNGCLENLFPRKQISQLIGYSLAEGYASIDVLTQIDCRAVKEKLSDILPNETVETDTKQSDEESDNVEQEFADPNENIDPSSTEDTVVTTTGNDD